MNTPQPSALRWQTLAGVAGSAVLLALYARGGLAWPLGFVVLLPWLLALNGARTSGAALLSGLLMSLGMVVAVFSWFAAAIGAYTGIGSAPAVMVLSILAPLLQPQVLAFAVVRQRVRAHSGALQGALAGAAAWVACEWLLPKLLGDTLGHGLQPSSTMRQAADLGGAAGLTVLLILVNEALALVVKRWRRGLRAVWPPLVLAIVVPTLMAGYGWLRLPTLFPAPGAEPVPSLRIGMVQSNITDYDRLRREQGAYAVVRQVLDTHFGMSQAAITQQGADALLWSETVYPTTFGQPQSADGAAFDREILDFVNATGVSLVFGSYDRDDAGEYNAAAFIQPDRGLIGLYRKTYPFPFTEHVPGWLDTPTLRRWLPWTGSWQPGSGARVFPLRTRDGRELNVVPLICLDAVHPQLAIDGARLGAQAIISLSNDAWFSAQPLGASLHLTVAAFRSIETRLPQLRVTSNGLSAIIDPTGEVVVSTKMGDQAILVGEVPVQNPPITLMVRWGDWTGGAALAFLLLLGGNAMRRRWQDRLSRDRPVASAESAAPWTATVVLLSPFWRVLVSGLRLLSGAGLSWLGLQMLLRDGLQVNSLAQLRWFAATVVAPALGAWLIQRCFAARATIEADHLLLSQATRRTEIPLSQLALMRIWRLPLPGPGIALEFASGRRWTRGLALADPLALLRALNASGCSVQLANPGSRRLAEFAAARAAARHWLDHALIKFVLFPLLPALPAFRLHQHIAFGGSFGEYYTYGLLAWLTGLVIWWAAWAIGLMLFAAVLRLLVELITVSATWARPDWQPRLRRGLERLARLVFYLGVPVWLLARLL